MAKRDPAATERNRRIDEMGVRLKGLLPEVLNITGITSEFSLHGIYGGKHDKFIDMKNAVIHTPEHFVDLWLKGFMDHLKGLGFYGASSGIYAHFCWLRDIIEVREYVLLFLKRTYLRYYESLSKNRPKVEQSTLWIGQNRASYGLLVTPRFNSRIEQWENDKSEIRHFKPDYWTIGHVIETGVVIPNVPERVRFDDLDQYLTFFEHSLVRGSGSPHEAAIADRYSRFVRAAADPLKIPLLIPEFRYAGLDTKHEHRLDFCVIDPFSLQRVGFELSPWSTHGEMTRLKGLPQSKINEIARANREAEMAKQKKFYRTHGVYTLIYTDTDLKTPDAVFADISNHLTPEKAVKQLELRTLDDLDKFRL